MRLLYSGNGDDHVHSVPEQPGTIAGRHGKGARRLVHIIITTENMPRLNHTYQSSVLLVHGDNTESGTSLYIVNVVTLSIGNLCRCTGYRPILESFKKVRIEYSSRLAQILKSILLTIKYR